MTRTCIINFSLATTLHFPRYPGNQDRLIRLCCCMKCTISSYVPTTLHSPRAINSCLMDFRHPLASLHFLQLRGDSLAGPAELPTDPLPLIMVDRSPRGKVTGKSTAISTRAMKMYQPSNVMTKSRPAPACWSVTAALDPEATAKKEPERQPTGHKPSVIIEPRAP